MTERERKEWRKRMIRLVRGTERRKVTFGKLLKEAADDPFKAIPCHGFSS